MFKDQRARLIQWLWAPTSIAPLVYFRIAFGLLLFWECFRFQTYGWVTRNFLNPDFHFHYFGFSWIHPWPGTAMVIHIWVMGLLSLCIALGLFYQIVTVLFFFAFTYFFLIDQAFYLNHFYLVALLSFLMPFLPAHRSFSLDVLRDPKIRIHQTPQWTVRLLQFQIGIPYFYGGIAKLSSLDWLRGQAMQSMIDFHFENPLIQKWMTSSPMVTFFTWTGLSYDLFVIPALLYRRTRLPALLATAIFHISNSFLFEIGIFPWLMLISTFVLFQPNLLDLEHFFQRGDIENAQPYPKTRELGFALLTAYFLIQTLLPFRHLLYPGQVSWTEEGHLFSWRMKLRSKEGRVTFHAVTTDGKQWVEADLVPHLPPAQMERFGIRLQDLSTRHQDNAYFAYLSEEQRERMEVRPELIRQYARFLSSQFERFGFGKVSVYAKAWVSLNERKKQLIINPKIDLAAQPESIRHAHWILPLKE